MVGILEEFERSRSAFDAMQDRGRVAARQKLVQRRAEGSRGAGDGVIDGW